MKFVIMGAGGVGGFYGARLARGGHDVTFIARGEHLKAIRQNGLRIESPQVGDFEISVNATDNPAEAGIADVIWMTVKDYGLEAASESIRPIMGENTVVIPLLNGVTAAERIGQVVGMERVMGGAVYVFANIIAPGVIRHGAADSLMFGELSGGITPRGEALQAAMKAAEIETVLSDNMSYLLWQKFLGIGAVSSVCTTARSPIGPLRDDPETLKVFSGFMEEIIALSRAKGIGLKPEAKEMSLKMILGLPPEARPSMLLDLEQGKPMEVEAIQGAAVRLGRELGVPTPLFDLAYAALKPWKDGRG